MQLLIRLSLNFRPQRHRYLQGVAAQFCIHSLSLVMGAGAVHVSLLQGSWVYLAAYFFVVTLLEGLLWYDRFFGWPAHGQ